MDSKTDKNPFVATVEKIRRSREAKYTEIAASIGITYSMLGNMRRGQDYPESLLEKLYYAYPKFSPDEKKYSEAKERASSTVSNDLAILQEEENRIRRQTADINYKILLHLQRTLEDMSKKMNAQEDRIAELVQLLKEKE